MWEFKIFEVQIYIIDSVGKNNIGAPKYDIIFGV